MSEATITLDSSRDSITFTATGGGSDIFGAAPSAGAFIYDDESLDSWYALPTPDVKASKRANAHGAFGLGRTTVQPAEPKIIGRYFGLSSDDAHDARERLSAMYNDGRPIVMRVTNVRGEVESRVVWVTSFDPDWTATDTFTLDMTFTAPDPRRYGPAIQSAVTGLGTPGTGLLWPLGTSTNGAGGVSETTTKVVTTGPAESTVLSLAVPGGAPLTVSMTASMVQNGVVKSGTLRIRDGVGGPVLGSYALVDKGDNPNGATDTWNWSGTAGTSGTAVLTAEANSGTAVYSSSRSMSTPGLGLYFDWGTPGASPDITLTNTGNSEAYPTFEVGGAGAFGGGFRIVEQETGREIIFERTVAQGSTVTLVSRTRRATMDGGDITEALSVREWFSVPGRSSRTYTLTAIGTTTGAPTYRATMMPANL